jgi:hypothetical protein
MSKLDIRNNEIEKPNVIIFGDGKDFLASQISINHNGKLMLTDWDDDLVHELDLDDVDNLILALKKAKELWGSE